MGMGELIRTGILICAALVVMRQDGLTHPLAALVNAAKPPVIVVGFVGGFVAHDNMVHSAVQLGAHLRETHTSGVFVKVFENRRRENAHREILKILDTNHDGTLSDEEKKEAHIIIYGMSWGGSETVSLAKDLDKDHIPVLLTIQVDSVAKMRQNDQMIPANVGEAVNFYQSDGLLRGQPNIRAADEKHTKILGNYRFYYKSKNIKCDKYPWFLIFFAMYHTRIECDAAVCIP